MSLFRRVRYPVVDYLDTASDIDHPFSDWRTREQARAFRVRPMVFIRIIITIITNAPSPLFSHQRHLIDHLNRVHHHHHQQLLHRTIIHYRRHHHHRLPFKVLLV